MATQRVSPSQCDPSSEGSDFSKISVGLKTKCPTLFTVTFGLQCGAAQQLPTIGVSQEPHQQQAAGSRLQQQAGSRELAGRCFQHLGRHEQL